jgi:hypothetical protein
VLERGVGVGRVVVVEGEKEIDARCWECIMGGGRSVRGALSCVVGEKSSI